MHQLLPWHVARAPVVAPAVLPAWVQNLALWTWYEIPNTALASVDPDPEPIGNTGPESKITAWCGSALRRIGSYYLIGAAGGHADYGGNEVDALQLNTEVPAWVQLTAPSANADIYDAEALFYADLRPAATHTYYSKQYINSRDLMVVVSLGGLSGLGAEPPAEWPWTNDTKLPYCWSWATQDWMHPETVAPALMTGDATSNLGCVHPITGDVYITRTGGDGWWRLNASTLTWTMVSEITESNYCGSAIDPTRDRMLIVGAFNVEAGPRVRGLDGTFVTSTFGGLGADPLKVGAYSGVVYDEANDTYLSIYNNNPIDVHRVDAETFVVDHPEIAGTPPADRPNGIHNSPQYVPELGGVVLANSYAGNAFFLRTSLTASPLI